MKPQFRFTFIYQICFEYQRNQHDSRKILEIIETYTFIYIVTCVRFPWLWR
jgi:hypothetical protein